MKVRAGYSAGRAGQCDHGSRLHLLPGVDSQLGAVRVDCPQIIGVLDHDVVAIAAFIACNNHRAREGGADGNRNGSAAQG